MKKVFFIATLLLTAMVFQYCSSSKKAAATTTTSYSKDIMPMIEASCSPCHFPPGGHKEPLNTLQNVKANIDRVIELVKLPKENKKFMPFMNKKPALTSEQITTLEKWKAEGMPE